MNPLIAALLGIVEGLTEYLPVSSTGHLILADVLLRHLFGLHGEGNGAFEIVIQLGAVLAVLVHFRVMLAWHVRGLAERSPESIALVKALVIAFVPTAAFGLMVHNAVKTHLFHPGPVAAALALGGVVMILVERARARRSRAEARSANLAGLEAVTPMRALAIGVGQCFSLWPGASRSMCTIVSGQVTGLSTKTAAEFSFLLALPTLGAATVYEAYKDRAELLDAGLGNVAIGFVISFVVAWATVAAFLRYLTRRGLEPFGYYRIVMGAIVLLLWSGT